ncbi:MAG: hypothetical protein GY936_00710 [Ignavibacteriae bacterium]|nr:hypothetical protein [Ignavibacteriota bacterium]
MCNERLAVISVICVKEHHGAGSCDGISSNFIVSGIPKELKTGMTHYENGFYIIIERNNHLYRRTK